MNMFVNIGDLGAQNEVLSVVLGIKRGTLASTSFFFTLRNTPGLAQCGCFQKVLKTHLV